MVDETELRRLRDSLLRCNSFDPDGGETTYLVNFRIIHSVCDEMTRAADELTTLRAENDNLRQEVRKFDDECGTLADEVNRLRAEVEHLKKQMAWNEG